MTLSASLHINPSISTPGVMQIPRRMPEAMKGINYCIDDANRFASLYHNYSYSMPIHHDFDMYNILSKLLQFIANKTNKCIIRYIIFSTSHKSHAQQPEFLIHLSPSALPETAGTSHLAVRRFVEPRLRRPRFRTHFHRPAGLRLDLGFVA